MYYNVNRWFGHGYARYTSPDPRGLPGLWDADDSLFNLYGYASNRPITWVDPLGSVSLPFDPSIPQRCHDRWQKKITPLLRTLAAKPKCKGFFCDTLKANLAQIEDDVFPFIASPPGRGGSLPVCLGEATAGIEVNATSLCGSTDETLHVVIHELGHYANCVYNGHAIPSDNTQPNGHHDACGAEVACFGFAIDGKCSPARYPRRNSWEKH